MGIYQDTTSTIGNLLRSIREDRSRSPLNTTPGSEVSSAGRNTIQQPLIPENSPGSNTVVGLRPEGIAGGSNPNSVNTNLTPGASRIGPMNLGGGGEMAPERVMPQVTRNLPSNAAFPDQLYPGMSAPKPGAFDVVDPIPSWYYNRTESPFMGDSQPQPSAPSSPSSPSTPTKSSTPIATKVTSSPALNGGLQKAADNYESSVNKLTAFVPEYGRQVEDVSKNVDNIYNDLQKSARVLGVQTSAVPSPTPTPTRSQPAPAKSQQAPKQQSLATKIINFLMGKR